MSEPEKYDFTTPDMIRSILTPGVKMNLDITGAQDAITQLAQALQESRKITDAVVVELRAEREKLAELEQQHQTAMSNMEMRMSRMQGPPKSEYRDGLRYQNPPEPPLMGADGFPLRGSGIV